MGHRDIEAQLLKIICTTLCICRCMYIFLKVRYPIYQSLIQAEIQRRLRKINLNESKTEDSYLIFVLHIGLWHQCMKFLPLCYSATSWTNCHCWLEIKWHLIPTNSWATKRRKVGRWQTKGNTRKSTSLTHRWYSNAGINNWEKKKTQQNIKKLFNLTPKY